MQERGAMPKIMADLLSNLSLEHRYNTLTVYPWPVNGRFTQRDIVKASSRPLASAALLRNNIVDCVHVLRGIDLNLTF